MGVYEQADLYTAAFDWPVEGEVDWLLREVTGVRRVLEPMCGNGRYGHAFADRGIEYHGFDSSSAMLQRARPDTRLRLHLADARDFSIPGPPFDLAWCAVSSIAHLRSETDVLRHLEAVREHLRPGGMYVLDLELVRHDGPWPHGVSDKSRWEMPQPDGTVVHAEAARRDCDLQERLATEVTTLERRRDGRILEQVSEAFPLRMWTADDLGVLTERGGFALERVHLGTRERPRVPLSRDLENCGHNVYAFLQRPLRPPGDARPARS